MKHLVTVLAFVCISAVAFAAGPSKREVLQAIAVLEKDVTSPKASEAAKTVVVFAQQSDDVMVDIGPVQLPWLDEEWGLEKDLQNNYKSMLMAAFVAGNIRSQIKNDKAEDDTYSGWTFVIDTYRRLRTKTPFKSAAIDELAKMQADGTLLEHARDAQISTERDQGPSPEHRDPA